MGHFPMLEKRGDHVVRNAVHCFLSVYPWASLWGCKTRKEIGWWPVWWLCWSMGGGTVPFRQDDLFLITLRLCLQQAVAESCSPVQVLAVVAQLLSVSTLQRHGLKHARLPCPSLSTRACSNSCSSSQWCHPTISSSVIPFSSCLQSSAASGSFPMTQLFPSSGQNIGASASASVLPMTTSSKCLQSLYFKDEHLWVCKKKKKKTSSPSSKP